MNKRLAPSVSQLATFKTHTKVPPTKENIRIELSTSPQGF